MATSTSTLDIIKASAKDLQSPDPAKKARALEIKKRYEAGAFNDKLVAEGAKPVPIKAPPVDLSKSKLFPDVVQQPGLQSRVPEKPTLIEESVKAAQDVPSDFMEMGKNISEYGSQQIDRVGENIARRGEDGTQSLGDSLMTGLDYVGATLGVASTTLFEGGKGLAKAVLTPEYEQKAEEVFQQMGQGVANTFSEGSRGREAAKEAIAAWEKLKTDKPEIANAIIDAGQVASFAGDIIGLKIGKEAGKELIDATASTLVKTASKTGEVVIPALREGGEALMSKVDEFSVANKAKRVATQEAKVDDAVGRIIQGEPTDIATAKKVLSEVDTTGIKTYSELNDRMDETLDSLRKRVDQELESDPTIYTKFKLARKTEVKGLDGKTKVVYDNPALNALDELEDFYTSVKDIPNKTKIQQYKQKLETGGLRLKDINDIARLHGKDLSGFNASGELASGLTKQAAENTRKGLKEVVRQNLPNDITRTLDESMSDILRTQELTKSMEIKVQKLYQKIKNRTLAQKVGGAIADVVDLVSLGTLRGFIQKLLPSNVGLKTANSLDLEKELAKNLKQIEKLLEIKDEKKFTEAVSQYLEEAQPGLSTRVTSGLKSNEKDALLAKLKNVSPSDVTSDAPSGASSNGFLDNLDLELTQRLDELSVKAEKAGGLSEREYAELKVLMDEVELNTNQTIAPSFSSGATPDKLIQEAKKYKSAEEFVKAPKYKTTVNIQDKNDLKYLEQILSRDSIEDIKNGKMTNWRGDTYEDLARINIVSETPKTIAQQLEGKVSDIKLKSNTFYHGTSAENAQGIMSRGFKTGGSLPESTFRGGGYGKMQNSISLAETPKEASIFSQLTRNGEIVEVKLKDNAKVVSIKGVEDATDLEDYISYLKKEKIDAVYIGGGEKELVVINPKAVIPTKSQLTDIWNKANGN